MKRILPIALAAAAAGLALLPAAFASPISGGSDLLQQLDKGMWQFRPLGGSSAAGVAQLCVTDSKQLAQIQHGNSACSQLVVKSSPTSVTISYSCRGSGQGLTTIRRETDRLIQIQSQGIRNNAPFSFSVEARRTGSC